MDRRLEFVNFKGDGVRLAGLRWAGMGPEVICVHGIAGSSAHWNIIARGIGTPYTFLCVDIRGRGRSEKPHSGYSVEQHGRDIAAMMNDLGLERAIIMGHSLGALIALSVAANNPDRVKGIILVDGGGALSPEQRDKVFLGIQPTLARLGKLFPSVEAYMDFLKRAPMLRPWSKELEEVFHYDLEVGEQGVRCLVAKYAVDEEIVNLSKVDTVSLQRKVACPALILRADKGMLGEDDLLLPPDVTCSMVSNIKVSKVINVYGSNHYTIVLSPNSERDRVISAFLGEL